MNLKPDARLTVKLRREFSDWRIWVSRVLVIGAAVVSGLTVVFFTWIAEHAHDLFETMRGNWAWSPLVWTPLCTGVIVWLTRRYVPGAAGSGIPQVMATLDDSVHTSQRGLFVSIKLSVAKLLLTSWGLLAGLSLGREGPSVQIAAGVMHSVSRWMPKGAPVNSHGLLVAGGAAGIAAAFNTPLAGVMFAIEELSRSPEQRSSGLIISAIVVAGLVAVSAFGNATYFGVIHVPSFGLSVLLPALLVALVTGLTGGLFARLLITSLSGRPRTRIGLWRQRRPVLFAIGCGFVVAVIGVVTSGATFGSSYGHTEALLNSDPEAPMLYALLKFVATWLTTWSGVPGGLFAPALAIGAALGNDVANLSNYPHAPTLIALGMAGFLAAVTQAPLTSFIIVMEMVDGHAMVLTLMACALVASGVSRLISQPLYPMLARLQLERLPHNKPPQSEAPAAATDGPQPAPAPKPAQAPASNVVPPAAAPSVAKAATDTRNMASTVATPARPAEPAAPDLKPGPSSD